MMLLDTTYVLYLHFRIFGAVKITQIFYVSLEIAKINLWRSICSIL